MPPSLATYQQAAEGVYEPLRQAERGKEQATTNASIANDEALKPQIQTDYQSAIDSLTSETKKNVGTINQLYTQRLGGNFSGLQGNDLGMMFSDANRQQATIESTRANKLSAISTDQTNLKNTLQATLSGIDSQYQSKKTEYAQSGYASAMKDYQDELDKQEQLNLSYAKLNSRSSGGSGAPSAAQTKQAVAQHVASQLSGNRGGDKKVSNETWDAALNDYIGGGLGNVRDFWKTYGQYVNEKYKSSYAGYHQR